MTMMDLETFAATHACNPADPSHDWPHIQRVREQALRIFDKEVSERYLSPTDITILRTKVEVLALLHEAFDSKVCEAIGVINTRDSVLAQVVRLEMVVVDANDVIDSIHKISFKGEMSGSNNGHDNSNNNTWSTWWHCVQDSDRLDAIGAIGIARAFTFGAQKSRPLSDTIQHFDDKLLKLKGMMKTRTGSDMAVARHAVMVRFLADWTSELM